VPEFDFDEARRWARFDRRKTLARRGDDELPFVNANLIAGQGLLLDTCVYINQMQDRSPQVVDELIAQRQINHSTIAVQELMHTVGVLSPSDRRTEGVIAEIGRQIRAMPPHRVVAPDVEVLGRAALLSGILCPPSRVQARRQAAGAPGLCAVPAGAEAWLGSIDRQRQRLRYPAPAHPGGAGAVLPSELKMVKVVPRWLLSVVVNTRVGPHR
jgi:hypothetical protein